MRYGGPQSLIFNGFTVACLGVVGGLFLLTTEIVDQRKFLLVFGVIFLVGVAMVVAGKLRDRRDGSS